MSRLTRDKWRKTMKEEIQSLKVNKVWTLVHISQGCNAIGNKWVLKLKRKADDSIERYKGYLIAKGIHNRKVSTMK